MNPYVIVSKSINEGLSPEEKEHIISKLKSLAIKLINKKLNKDPANVHKEDDKLKTN